MSRRTRRLTITERRARGARLASELIEFLRTAHGWRIVYVDLSEDSHAYGLLELDGPLAGAVYISGKMMLIDHKEDAFSTIVHEYLHVLRPRTHELTIRAMERDVMHALTSAQAAKIHRLVAPFLCTYESFLEEIARVIGKQMSKTYK